MVKPCSFRSGWVFSELVVVSPVPTYVAFNSGIQNGGKETPECGFNIRVNSSHALRETISSNQGHESFLLSRTFWNLSKWLYCYQALVTPAPVSPGRGQSFGCTVLFLLRFLLGLPQNLILTFLIITGKDTEFFFT